MNTTQALTVARQLIENVLKAEKDMKFDSFEMEILGFEDDALLVNALPIIAALETIEGARQ